MQTLTHFFNRIDLSDYVRNYRDADTFISLCQSCERYGRSWACPPFADDADRYLSAPYRQAYFIGTRIGIDPDRPVPASVAERDEAIRQILESTRRTIDPVLLALERKYTGSRAFFAGSCIGCPKETCTRISGASCRYPDRIRPSLESIGFNVAQTSADLFRIPLQWSRDNRLPDYFMLVSALFTREPVDMLEYTWKQLLNISDEREKESCF